MSLPLTVTTCSSTFIISLYIIYIIFILWLRQESKRQNWLRLVMAWPTLQEHDLLLFSNVTQREVRLLRGGETVSYSLWSHFIIEIMAFACFYLCF